MIEFASTLAVDKDGLDFLQRIFGVSPATEQTTGLLRTAEHRLMLDVLLQAVVEAASTNSWLRTGARAWLRASPGFTARDVCDALGYDYDSIMRKLEAAWNEHPNGVKKSK